MAADRLLTADAGRTSARASLVWALPVAFLVGLWLWVVFASAGYPAEKAVVPLLVLGVAGLVAGGLVAYPRRPRQLALGVLLLLAAYTVWVAASNLWAAATEQAWLGTVRTLAYLLIAALASAYFTSTRARVALRYLLMLGAFVLVLASIWRLWSAADLGVLFSAKQLAFPAGFPDAAAAVFLLPFWPLMWLAAGPEEHAPVRGAAVGLATGLIGLALMTQSRSAAWSLAITVLVMFAVSPGRLRLLLYLVVPGLLMVYAFPRLEAYWVAGPESLDGAVAARTLTVAIAAAAFMGMIVALLEGWVKVTGRMRAVFGTVILLACLAGLVYGAITYTRDIGGPVTWIRDTWSELTGETAAGGTLDAAVAPDVGDSHSRWNVWTQTWGQAREALLLGLGEDNSGVDAGTPTPPGDGGSPPLPHSESLALQVLGDTGIVGAVFAFGAIALSVVGILLPRFAVGGARLRRAWAVDDTRGTGESRPRPARPQSRWGANSKAYGWQMALFTAATYWFVQANLEPLWRFPGVTMPALLVLAAALATTDAQAGTFWPGLARRLSGARRRPVAVEGSATATPARERGGDRAILELRPPGALSQGFRISLVVFSAAVLVLQAAAYVVLLH